ncbi:FK506-binding protein 15 isoform X2 [Amblyraja radiata]|uniref:FK506-binding protein 15 isoform X2 n=1 Tax=Amblyraja radiata TaxID=386614 RepID=UPI001401C0B0|nr:FK506-binding protein 15 isoform X2 [Amblyraja radiata]
MAMFGAEEDDVDFFSSSGGAKLASLFGMDQAAVGQGNESFQYTAPKQPKKGAQAPGAGSQKPATTGASPAVLFATAVHAYQYLNGQYVKQGKLGAAILGNHASGEFKVLLYASQQKRIAAARITSTFTFTVQANNYCMFYDDQKQNWSIMFDSDKAVIDFSKQVCLAKCNCTSSLESVLVQDLSPGEGPAVETGDSLEVSYTGWLYQNNTFGQVFDTNINKDKLLRLKLGSGKVIKGWEVGMLGMKKNSKRLLIIPPSQAYGSQGMPNRIPPDATLLFEVEVKRVKFIKEPGFDRQSTGSRDSVASSPAPSVESLAMETSIPAPVSVPPKPGEHNVRAKSNSLNDMLSNPGPTKAKLISRMAKMGQPMPFLAGALSAQPDSSDSELEDHSRGVPLAAPPAAQHTAAPVHSLPPQHPPSVPVCMLPTSSAALVPVVLPAQQGLPGSAQSFQPYTGMHYGYAQGHGAQTQIQSIGPMYPAQAPQYQAGGDVTSFMMTEARQHNTEIRLAISKASDKIDHLALKMEDLQKHTTGPSIPGISSFTMETSMIMHNIQRIIQENERLKQEVFDKSSRIEEQNGKISELIQRNQRYVEQSNLLMEQRNDSLMSSTENNQARVLLVEQEKVKVTEELALATGQIARLQLELMAHQKQEMELRTQLASAQQKAEDQGLCLSSVEMQFSELQETSERAQTKCKAEKQSRKQLQVKVAGMEEELVDLRAEKDNLVKSSAERKRKAVAEQQRAELEMEELRKSYEEELGNVRSLLRKARTSTDQAAAEQISVMQAELESQWQVRCDRMLTSAKEQHSLQYGEVCEQRESQQLKISQLEAKLAAWKVSRATEEEKLVSLQEQADELQTLREQYSSLESRAVAMKEHYERRLQELRQQAPVMSEAPNVGNTVEEVKKIMNGVFQSLRGEFELDDTYSGRSVLGTILSTIKAVTLQLLVQSEDQALARSGDEGEESEDETEEKAAPPVESENTEVVTNLAEGAGRATCEEDAMVLAAGRLSQVTLSPSHPPVEVEPDEDRAEPQDPKLPTLEQPLAPNIPAQSWHPTAGEAVQDTAGEGVQDTAGEAVQDMAGESVQDTAGESVQDTAGEGVQDTAGEAVQDTAGESVQDTAGFSEQCVDEEGEEDEAAPLPESGRSDGGVQDCERAPEEQHNAVWSRKLDSDSVTERMAVAEQGGQQSPPQGSSVSGGQDVSAPPDSLIASALHGKDGSPDITNHSPLHQSQAPLEHNTLHVAEHESNAALTAPEPRPGSSPNASSDDDDDSLFKSAMPKAGKTVRNLANEEEEEEEEEDEEVSMKGRPPPTPLFGDDDDEDDFDWLG